MTIDLQSTLIRAEALFRRFQRTVETIDKKDNFPTPSVRQRRPQSSDSANGTSNQAETTGSSASTAARPAPPSTDVAEKAKVISPELRKLLSRKVETMDSREVKKHGGGVGS
jgi:TBC1 domain family member 15